ncbi:TlpA family protein disulfide reductase [Nocardioides xinjiangensis]|uniref:TlpA family protein disulfide reductase n=1 Tax=Nocardioides xinjiangensis TaxID=2817376 RepID=UPI001B30F3C4|nr:thioredoxin family protein [Nocardioides sp. SYSU D00514]
MSSAPLPALVVALTLVAVLATSGAAKLRDRRATRDAFTALRVPGVVPADAAATVLPWAELALAVALVLAPDGWLTVAAAAVLVLMLAYTALVARALRFEEPVTCSCFGSLGRHDVDRTTVARNLLLSALAAALFASSLDGGSVAAALGALDRDGWWALLATLAAAAVAVLVVGGPGPSGSPAADGDLLDYERQAVPYGSLTLRDGRTASLLELSATQARLLVVLTPGCGPCVRTAERLDAWAARLGPAVGVLAVYPDEQSAEAAVGHAPELAAWEPELNVRRLFSVGAPAAVLLGADGYLAGGPVAGEEGVADFVEEVLAALVDQPDLRG